MNTVTKDSPAGQAVISRVLSVFSSLPGVSESCLDQAGNAGVSSAGGDCGPSQVAPLGAPGRTASLSKREQVNQGYRVEIEVQEWVRRWGVEYVVFITLTHSQKIYDKKEHERQFNSIRPALIGLFPGGLQAIDERHDSGGWHVHLVGHVKEDVKTGFDWDDFKRHRWGRGNWAWKKTQAAANLRPYWKEMRRICARHKGWGINGVEPIEKNGEAAAKYLSKYMLKRSDGGRRISYIGHWPRATNVRMKMVCGRARSWALGGVRWWQERHGATPEWDQVKTWLRHAAMNAGRCHNVIGERCESWCDWFTLGVALDGGTFADYGEARGLIPAYASMGYNYTNEMELEREMRDWYDRTYEGVDGLRYEKTPL